MIIYSWHSENDNVFSINVFDIGWAKFKWGYTIE